MVKAIKLILKEETTFDLFFYDGSVKRYDILNLADKYPQLNKLKDRSLFLKGKLIGYSGVIFDDELDIDAQTVYEEGIDCRDEYDDVELVVLGYKVKEARLKRGLSQMELSSLIGIDQSDLSKIEKGLANPSLKTLKRIADGMQYQLSIDFNLYS